MFKGATSRFSLTEVAALRWGCGEHEKRWPDADMNPGTFGLERQHLSPRTRQSSVLAHLGPKMASMSLLGSMVNCRPVPSGLIYREEF
uniref:Uncharacterized protein n=1 Tax=Timema poppense TaxID=170557 RepID=A0A7R9DQI2_TIMPO|nr:unnamed protein product [Timema poppensis]